MRSHRDIFDSAKLSFRTLLEFFFQIHDPTTLNRQGNDRGTSYRSAIFYTSDEQKRVAEDTIADVEARVYGQGRSSPKLFPRANSGRPSPSIRITWNVVQTAIPATTSGRTGNSDGRKRAASQA